AWVINIQRREKGPSALGKRADAGEVDAVAVLDHRAAGPPSERRSRVRVRVIRLAIPQLARRRQVIEHPRTLTSRCPVAFHEQADPLVGEGEARETPFGLRELGRLPCE